MRKTNLEEVLNEIILTRDAYNRTENKEVKEHYDKYVNLLIENDVPYEFREVLHKYWGNLK